MSRARSCPAVDRAGRAACAPPGAARARPRLLVVLVAVDHLLAAVQLDQRLQGVVLASRRPSRSGSSSSSARDVARSPSMSSSSRMSRLMSPSVSFSRSADSSTLKVRPFVTVSDPRRSVRIVLRSRLVPLGLHVDAACVPSPSPSAPGSAAGSRRRPSRTRSSLTRCRERVTHVCLERVGVEIVGWRSTARFRGESGTPGTSAHSATTRMILASRLSSPCFAGDLVDLVAPRGRDHLLEEHVGAVERDERADVVAGETDRSGS